MSKKPEQITIEEELHICPECGYEDGFHTSFVRQTKNSAFQDGTISRLNTCPCLAYDIYSKCHFEKKPLFSLNLHSMVMFYLISLS